MRSRSLPAERYRSRRFEDISPGADLPTLRMPLPYRRVIQMAAATRDYFPGHHEPSYAQAQGVENIYLNTMFYHGLLDRYVLEWSGPAAFLQRRRMHMKVPIVAGDTAVLDGCVLSTDIADGEGQVEVQVEVKNGAGVVCCPATLWLLLPLTTVP
ncbi:MAG: hypothetical protein SV583_02945 [Pseudomonadota bacterium]|nr:hypothetical protein [Pseudomonadota bacterium]